MSPPTTSGSSSSTCLSPSLGADSVSDGGCRPSSPALLSVLSQEHAAVKIQPPLPYRESARSGCSPSAKPFIPSAAISAAPFVPSSPLFRAPPPGFPPYPMSMDGLVSQDYLDQLIRDKTELRASHNGFRHLSRLIDTEIRRVVKAISHSYVENGGGDLPDDVAGDGSRGGAGDASKGRVVLQEKIFVPIDKYPGYNFVGRILGPRGMTAKQLEEETGCKIMVRGRGSCRTEPLHVLIHAEDHADVVEEKLRYAVDRINALLSPPPEGKDELKRKQLIELSIINGTYRPTTATKLALQSPRTLPSPYQPPSSQSSSAYDNSLLGLLGNDKRRPRLGLGDFSSSSPMSAPPSPTSLSSASVTALPLGESSAAQLANLSATLLANPILAAEYYKQMLSLSMGDVSLFSSLLSNTSCDVLCGMSPPSAAAAPLIPPATMQQYLTAAAMLNSMPFSSSSTGPQDGSGDSIKGKH